MRLTLAALALALAAHSACAAPPPRAGFHHAGGWDRPGWHDPGWSRPGWHRPGWDRPGWERPHAPPRHWDRPHRYSWGYGPPRHWNRPHAWADPRWDGPRHRRHDWDRRW